MRVCVSNFICVLRMLERLENRLGPDLKVLWMAISR